MALSKSKFYDLQKHIGKNYDQWIWMADGIGWLEEHSLWEKVSKPENFGRPRSLRNHRLGLVNVG